MILKNIQLTLTLPYYYDDTAILDVLTEVKDSPWVQRCLRDGRNLSSWGITHREGNETDVVLNFD